MKYAVSRITLDLQDTSSPITLSVKQGDSRREIVCGFRDDSGVYQLDSDCQVIFTAEKPDGNKIYDECVVEGNFARFKFTAQTVSCVGAMKAEFKIFEGIDKNPKLTSPRFMVNVEAPVFNDGDIPESSYEFNAIKDLVVRTVTGYLEEHPTITDATLTKPDFAADAKATGESIGRKLEKSGDTMTGDLAMSGNRVTGLGTPVDAGDAATKAYVDGKHVLFTVSLPASGWSEAAPFTQSMAVSGLLGTDTPVFGAVYAGEPDGKLAQKEAFALVDELEVSEGNAVFSCFEDRPTVDLTIQMEVNR